jgi:CRP-like cAMP-binding protein
MERGMSMTPGGTATELRYEPPDPGPWELDAVHFPARRRATGRRCIPSPFEVEQIARLFKERRFSQGDTVAREGSGGAAFFLIDAGEATVSVGGQERTTLKPGDYFAEIP